MQDAKTRRGSLQRRHAALRALFWSQPRFAGQQAQSPTIVTFKPVVPAPSQVRFTRCPPGVPVWRVE
jgi:hypothetical protein